LKRSLVSRCEVVGQLVESFSTQRAVQVAMQIDESVHPLMLAARVPEVNNLSL